MRFKIILLVFSILIPFLVVDTIILKSLSQQAIMVASEPKHLAAMGKSFFNIFIIKTLMAIVVSAVVVSIVFWIVGPWRNLGRKVIRTLGKGTNPLNGTDEIRYAMELLDKINNTAQD